MRRLITKQIREEIIYAYREGELATSISKRLGWELSSIFRVLKEEGVACNQKLEYGFDKCFFDEVDSEPKAYVLGFLYADGYNGAGSGRWRVAISLAMRDEEILHKIKSCLQSAHPVSYEPKRGTGGMCRLVVSNQHFSERLSALGCHNRKSLTLEFPEWITPALLPHFMRGYMDGDGWIHSGYRQERMGAVGSDAFIHRFAQLLEQNCGVHATNTPNSKSKGVTTCQVAGRDQTATVLAWLYKDATIYLERKKRKAEQILVPTYLSSPYGSASHLSVLTEETVRNVRDAILAGLPTREILETLNVTKGNLKTIRSGKTWNHVTGWGDSYNQAPGVARGFKHYRNKLSEQNIRDIMPLIESGTTNTAIAKQFGVSKSAILQIRRGLRWTEITGYTTVPKGRTVKTWSNANAKLTNEQVIEIKALLRAGQSGNSVAKKFDVSGSTISLIVRGSSRYGGLSD